MEKIRIFNSKEKGSNLERELIGEGKVEVSTTNHLFNSFIDLFKTGNYPKDVDESLKYRLAAKVKMIAKKLKANYVVQDISTTKVLSEPFPNNYEFSAFTCESNFSFYKFKN